MASPSQLLDQVLVAATSGSWDWDIHANQLWIDERFAELYGLEAHQARTAQPPATFFLRIHEDDLARMRIAIAGMLGGSENFSKEFRVQTSDGSYRWMHGRGKTLLGANDEPLRFTGLLVDVTERKLAEERLRIAQKAGGIGTFEYIDGFATVSVSDEFCRLLGLIPSVALPLLTINRIAVKGDGQIIPESVAEVGTELAGEFQVTRPDNQEARWIARRGEIVREGNARGFRLIGVIYDVTAAKEAENRLRNLNDTLEARVQAEIEERLKTEGQLRQAQKMDAVGQLTGGIAHDFNNMLAVIIGGLNLAQRKIAKGDREIDRFLVGAIDGARRAAALTQRLLAFSRQQPLAPETLDLNKMVAGMNDMLDRALGEMVHVETILGVGLWQVHADLSQLESAVLNLSVNARDAMPNGGKLTIETTNAFIDERYAQGHALTPGQFVLIAVTDSGSGMSEETIERAFDPFFTTKEVGKGTGLGLSQVYGFVRQSGGHVKIYSELEVGTTVKVYLPRYVGEVGQRVDDVRVLTDDSQKRELIFVVEDDERVRAISVEALRDLGYRVVDAASPVEAIRLIKDGARPDLLFTDVVMPLMSGRALAAAVGGLQPGLKILFTTAYTRNAIVHNGILDPGTNLLSKPFSIEELAKKVRSILDGAP